MEHPSAAVSESLQVMDDSIPVAVGPSSPATINFVRSREKRKRGRPDKVQMVTATKPRLSPKIKVEDEDVCFICFDGGSLVLCDRKGCPKAYHPACIKRDEAFFESTAKWYCGWHICSVCLKASHNMCYTCTYSLCKGCAKDADYFSVRGNMGFCTTCMKTIMLIENKDQANKELVQVDFDDKGSWEYLFKVYWILLKENLSLTFDELTKAKNPCKGLTSIACRQQLPDTQHVHHSNGFFSNVPHEHSKLLKPMEQVISTEKASNVNGASLIGPVEWASKELLELVAHMKNGDTSVLSQFDVQVLLLEYVKKNNLRDPHWDSKINCDLRLKSLFGKPCVGHIEMLKLLEFHFSKKEDSEKNAFIPAGTAGIATSPLGCDDNNENSLLTNKIKRQKTRNQVEERAPQHNLDDHAASGLSDQEDVRSGPEIPTTTLATEGSFSPIDNETDQLWYYRDPNGNIQGPFSMIQLRKWSTTGYFPPDMRIWTIDEQDDSILLTDAINSSFHTAAHLLYNFSLQCQQLGAATSSSPDNCNQNVGDLQSNNDSEFVRSDGLGSISSGSTTSVVSEKDMQPGTSQHSELKDNNSSSDRSQVCQPPPSSSVEPRNGALSYEGQGHDHGSEGSRPSPHHENKVSPGAADPISDVHNENQSNCKRYLRQSSGQNWRPFPINLNLNDMDTNCGFSPATKSDKFEHDSDVDLPELPKDGNQESSGLAAEKLQPVSSDVPAQMSDVRYLPRPTPKPPINEDQRRHIADSKPPPAAKVNSQDLGPSWGTDTTLVVGGANREIADEWGRYSPTLAKPSVADWSSGLVSVLSLKQPEVGSDHAIPTSDVDPLASTSPADPTSNNNNSSWQSVVETIEFSTLAEESVSDLLAEVDAMESQCGLGSPTSAMKFRDERMKSCKNDDCFSIGDLSPSPDPGKSDALSSTGDIQFLFDEPVGASRADAYDILKHSRGHSSTSSEGETKAANIPSTKQREAGSAVHPRSSRPMSLDITDTSMPGNNGLTALDTFWGREPGHVNLDWGAPAERNLNIGWGKSQQALGGNLNFDQGASNGGIVWDGQQKYSGERYSGPPFWNRQPLESDGGYSRPPPKGQRVCKYSESGRCKKGALCNYLHP